LSDDRLTIRYIPLSLALLWDDNKKRHDIGALIQSFKRHGFKDSPKFEPTLNGGEGGIVEGNGRFIALDAMRGGGDDPPRGIAIDDDGKWLVPVTFGVDAASEAAAKAYGVDHNALTLSGGDFDLTDHMRLWSEGFDTQLIELAQEGITPVAFDDADIQALLDVTGAPSGAFDIDDEPPLADYVPDAIFPSQNEWGVPDLLPDLQADFLELPFTRWGEISRKNKMRGTYHFYTDDYRFNALWDDPLDLPNSRCVAIVEPNASTNEQMPMAVGLWRIYRKRWLARYCQNYGVKVWVDLNVSPKFAELNLLGVPRSWRAYATRGLDKHLDLIERDHALAVKHSESDDLLFLVYGGGAATETECKARGWLWLPENMHVKDGRRERRKNG